MSPSLRLVGLIVLIANLGSLAPRAGGQEDSGYSRPVNAAPQPESIGGDYQLPAVQRAAPRGQAEYVLDAVLLVAAMAAVAYACHRGRRRGVAAVTSLAVLAYFGFWREGCVCPIGATQNIAASLADPTVAVPWVVIAFFFVPLISALLFGRVFCGGACALGAIQDAVLLWPRQLPTWVDRWGGALRYVYLTAAIGFAVQPAAHRDFIICRFDPFVGLFRLSGSAALVSAGLGLLVLGMFVGRPYCRFLCPYGGLLSIVARFAWRPISITPDREIDCRLCAEACPFGAIEHCRASRTRCLACARCFASCPRQHAVWQGDLAAALPHDGAAPQTYDIAMPSHDRQEAIL